MLGGAGNDTYVVDDAGDVVTEARMPARIPSRRRSPATRWRANVENLTFTGTGAFTGTGNAANNVITGGASNDTLDGGAGNDTLNGGGGDDTSSAAQVSTFYGAASVRIFSASSPQPTARVKPTTPSRTSRPPTSTRSTFPCIDANTKLAGFQSFTFISSASFTRRRRQLSFSNGFLRRPQRRQGVGLRRAVHERCRSDLQRFLALVMAAAVKAYRIERTRLAQERGKVRRESCARLSGD